MSDADYVAAGAKVVATAAEVLASADMIVKVKEPQPRSARCCARARSSSPTCTSPPTGADRPRWSQSGATAIAYETVTATGRHAAAADADERGRGPHGDPGGREVPGESAWRAAASCSAACRACAPAQGRDPRRRRGRRERRAKWRSGCGADVTDPRLEPRPRCATSTTCCGGRRAHAVFSDRRTSTKRSSRPTWSSAPC